MYDYIMMRTQISLTPEERRLLDDEAMRTGRSLSALIRDAVSRVYGEQQDPNGDRRLIEEAFGAWNARELDGADYVERVRSGARLGQVAER